MQRDDDFVITNHVRQLSCLLVAHWSTMSITCMPVEKPRAYLKHDSVGDRTPLITITETLAATIN